MKAEKKLHSLIEELTNKNKIIQISGKSGVGKSTLAMNWIKTLNTMKNSEGMTVYIDSDNTFSMKRFKSLKYHDEKFTPMKNMADSIFLVSPKNYFEQERAITNGLYRNKAMIEGTIKVNCIVFDTVSNFFRNTLADKNSYSFTRNLQIFYEEHIYPLLIFQKKTGCILIFIHQMSSHPTKGDHPIFYPLFKRIPSSWIHLEQDDKQLNMKISNNKTKSNLKYEIALSGINIIDKQIFSAL